MTFELWSIWHILYILSSGIIFLLIYLGVKNRSEKTKYTVGVVLGVISLLILIVRNVDIYLRSGWDLEIIPLQVCHIGNLVTGFALITKRKWLLSTAFCFNAIPAFLATVFADSLANYDTLLKIRPQSYIWGHILIVICALYGIMVYLPRLTKKDLAKAIAFVGISAVTAIICNSAFRATLGWEPNYFYLYNYKGTPLKFLYNAFPSATYGWFTINWFYSLTLILVFVAVFVGMFYLAKLIVDKLSAKKEA
jgi:uncharacterized membrane protein YwaF